MRYRRTTQRDPNLIDHDDVMTTNEVVDQSHYDEDVVTDQRRSWYYGSLPARVNSVLFAVLAAIEGLLALRFALLAFGANATSGFVEFIYDVSYVFMAPFNGAFADRTWDEGIIELDTLLAMGVWAIGFLLLAMLVNAILPRYDDSGTRVTRSRVTHS
jgi:hypothetical protein